MAEQSGGNNSKTGLTMIVGLFAVIAGVYSMMEPLGQRVDFISMQLEGAISRETIAAREERDDHALLKSLETRLKQVEKDRDNSQEWQDDHDLRVRGLNSAQWERIRSLERQVYGKSMPISIGEAPGAQSDY